MCQVKDCDYLYYIYYKYCVILLLFCFFKFHHSCHLNFLQAANLVQRADEIMMRVPFTDCQNDQPFDVASGK